jgi:hypothetical protein
MKVVQTGDQIAIGLKDALVRDHQDPTGPATSDTPFTGTVELRVRIEVGGLRSNSQIPIFDLGRKSLTALELAEIRNRFEKNLVTMAQSARSTRVK